MFVLKTTHARRVAKLQEMLENQEKIIARLVEEREQAKEHQEQAKLRISALEQLLNEFCAFTEKFPHSRTRQAWCAVRNVLIERYAALPGLEGETSEQEKPL